MLRTTTLALAALLFSNLATAAPKQFGNAFVLVEIFTSEGCSSCPKADNYANALVRQARTQKLPLYVLAWHVDYWNKLKTAHGAWADPFSSPESTKRQSRYVKTLSVGGAKAGRIGTPQILVDGRYPHKLGKGGNSVVIQGRINRERKAGIAITRTGTGVDWVVKEVEEEGCEILIALVQRGIKQKVGAGENYGRELEHENVVRWHTIVKLDKNQATGKTRIELPKGVPSDAADIIAVVQKRKDMAVLAASLINWESKK